MQDQLMEVIIGSLGTILIALIGWATKVAVVWLNSKGVTEKIKGKKYLVDIGVHAAEQAFKHEDSSGPEKFVLAKKKIVNALNENGLKISEDELEDFIEAAVHEMSNGFQQGMLLETPMSEAEGQPVVPPFHTEDIIHK